MNDEPNLGKTVGIIFGFLFLIVFLLGCGKPKYPAPYGFNPPTVILPTPTPPTLTGWPKIQEERWNAAQTRPEKVHYAQAIALAVQRGKPRYEAVAGRTGVPWMIIGCIHNEECDLNFRQNLANGDPLTARTIHVPKGRPPNGSPPFSWETAAIDSLQYDHLDTERWDRIGYELQNTEQYNGLGYQKNHPEIPSPYLWSWTTISKPGKFIADGQWSSTAVSAQCGVSPILKVLYGSR